MNVRTGANPATSNYWEIGPGRYFQNLCSPGVVSGQATAPFRVIQYVTPGVWTSESDTEYVTASGTTDFTGFTYLARRLAARRDYTQNFGAAVAGPAPIQPDIEGNLFRFNASDLFDIPGFQGDDVCCARTTATLRRGSHKLSTVHLNEWRGRIYLQRTVTRAGWYNFDISASRWNPHGPEPAYVLSPKATIHWHFYIRPVPPAGNTANFPITVTTYEPRGLSMSNQAQPAATTTVPFQIVRNGRYGDRARQYPFRTVRVLASFNDGKSWQRSRSRGTAATGWQWCTIRRAVTSRCARSSQTPMVTARRRPFTGPTRSRADRWSVQIRSAAPGRLRPGSHRPPLR